MDKSTQELRSLAEQGCSYIIEKVLGIYKITYIGQFPFVQYQLGTHLGSGDDLTGSVFEANNIITNETYAIKFKMGKHDIPVTNLVSSKLNLTALSFIDDYCKGPLLALKTIGKQPYIVRIYHAGIGIILHNGALKCITVMAKAEQLREMKELYPDTQKMLKMIMEFFDGLKTLEKLNVSFSDLENYNVLYANGSIKIADFDSNIIFGEKPSAISCAIFRDIVRNFLFPRSYNSSQWLRDKEKALLFEDSIDLTQESVCKNRNTFEAKASHIISEYSTALCIESGENEKVCRQRFSFFNTTKKTTSMEKFLLTAFGSLGMQMLRKILKSYLSPRRLSEKQLDVMINISVAFLVGYFSQNYLSSSIALLLTISTNNALAPFILFTAQTVNELLDQDSPSTLLFAKELIVSLFGTGVGIKSFELLEDSYHEVSSKTFCHTTPCTIL